MLGFTLLGFVVVILALPVSAATRNHVITLIGVLVSGIVAFSSTTIVANFMAGIMLRINKPFKTGDFIQIGDHFGRVSERGLLDTEIQSEHRELISLPNAYLISTPLTAVSSTGAIVSATLSLGYDIHHARIQSLLIDAAGQTGLEDPFVQIIELGNDAVTYRISGLLTDVKSMLTTRSNLHQNILDTLHNCGVEIVSPGFVNQRRLADQLKIIPSPITDRDRVVTPSPEAIVFDKAEQAELKEAAKESLQDEIKSLEDHAGEVTGDEKHRIKELKKQKSRQLAELEIAEQEKGKDDHKK
jgi:small-conductance mechanosensitive channel